LGERDALLYLFNPAAQQRHAYFYDFSGRQRLQHLIDGNSSQHPIPALIGYDNTLPQKEKAAPSAFMLTKRLSGSALWHPNTPP
jgi:hypothetical protein